MADKVLVADGEPLMRDLLNLLVERDGYNVILASNGEDAIEIAQKENPLIILLDIKLPGLDSIEVCKRLKADKNTRSIPIILITGYADNRAKAIEAGADDLILKPFDMVELSARVKSIIRIRYLTIELEEATSYIRNALSQFACC